MFGIEKKTRMVWLPDCEKIEDMFIRFNRIHTNVTDDSRTDRQVDRHCTAA